MSQPSTAELACGLADLGEVEIVRVTSRYTKAHAQWTALMEANHPQGSGPLRGAQIRYLITSSEHGLLGGLSFSAATLRLKKRDSHIGWSEAARRANLSKVVQNSRFLIAPTVEVPNLASHVLAKALGRISEDWQEHYGVEPVLVETFVDPTRFDGACYKAANWNYVGQTAARSDGFANGKVSSGAKDIYLYPLHGQWVEQLRNEPPVEIRRRNWSEMSSDWAEREFGGAQLYDNRLRKRLTSLARDFYAQPGTLIPQMMSGQMAKSVAAYRFFSNERIDMQSLLHGHVEATLERMAQHKVVLAVQDTSTLNYTGLQATEGLGPINNKADKSVGMMLHPTLAVSMDGTPLGLLDVQCWARDPEQKGKAKDRTNKPIEEKESYRWLRSYEAAAVAQRECPDTMVVSVGDRESDIYELFDLAYKSDNQPHVLVRADKGRKRKAKAANTQDDLAPLWEMMGAQPVAGQQQVFVPGNGSRRARIAELEVRHCKVTLKAPEPTPHKKGLIPLELWAVYATEVDPPEEVTRPLEWMLLTTVPTETADEAHERLRWYTLRWNIEVYFRTLKSGNRILDRRLATADSLQACLAIDLVVAWRVYWLVKQGRETPDVSCDLILEEQEWKTLYLVSYRKPPPDKPMGLREAVRLIAKLGGFLGRKSDGEPGATTIWRGLGRLGDMAIMYQILAPGIGPPPG